MYSTQVYTHTNEIKILMSHIHKHIHSYTHIPGAAGAGAEGSGLGAAAGTEADFFALLGALSLGSEAGAASEEDSAGTCVEGVGAATCTEEDFFTIFGRTSWKHLQVAVKTSSLGRQPQPQKDSLLTPPRAQLLPPFSSSTYL
jgi:hypothetical protein